ncbi:hypothetical protein [Flavobacterium branchiophilum]|uniref:Uncharacterized protein n=1 Tax=Flavobacterium branchiophilum TaxID=55197 RepID=A0A2H3KLG3_9FLAO|nr:hypothetical protein [Flavobacterium branchiophilum]PDS26488.1 hypothetical protein B0A77_02410 [Flavobacterium branchiophilum]
MKNALNDNHRKPIGFKVTDNKLAVIEPNEEFVNFSLTNDVSFEQMMKLKGLEQAILLIKQYFNGHKPLVDNRDEYFFKQLVEIRNRFYNPLL